jgi:hypothetical protein
MATRKILLVEGNDDEHVIKHVCGTRGVQKVDEIKQQGNVEQLLANLPVRLKESDVEVLGVVIDAHTDLAARWRSLHDRLAKAGYGNIPAHPLPDGTILDPPAGTLLPRVGIWIMPNNQTKGILEDFLRFLIPGESRLFDHVQSSVANIPKGEQRFNQLAEPKAIIHTWLAWQKEPGKPLGTTITARYLDTGVKQVDVFVSWMNHLFFQ